jgi:hypothetical protein
LHEQQATHSNESRLDKWQITPVRDAGIDVQEKQVAFFQCPMTRKCIKIEAGHSPLQGVLAV